jgi:ion channel-forming bestrophin family protein
MYTNRRYGYWMTILWSKRGLIFGAITGFIAVLGYEVLCLKWLSVPWQPVALIGTALAFYLGFKNNASYDRLWEARKIWGAILNGSRAFSAGVLGYVSDFHGPANLETPALHEIRRTLIFRHLAWVTALRYQLRAPRAWEHVEVKLHDLYPQINIAEFQNDLNEQLLKFISAEELQSLEGKGNKAVQILTRQTQELHRLRSIGLLDDFRHVELQKMIAAMYDEQGKAERIKNFPFPRQYATVPLLLIKLMSILMPFALLTEFSKLGPHLVWLTVPFSALVTWVFILMEMIGDFSENPFEGTYNDVPITSISRTIEIDLKEMLGEKEVPPALQPIDGMLL